MGAMIEIPHRLPPHNLDAERAVLGCVLLEGAAALQKVGALEPDDFYTGADREIFGTLLAMAAAGADLDIVTLAEELRRRDQLEFVGGAPYLALLLEQASIGANLKSYAAIVRQHATLRETIVTATQIITQAFDAKDDVRLVVDQALGRFESLAKRAVVAEERFKALRLDELRRLDIQRPWFLIDNWIPGEALTFLVGDSEAFKSWTAKYIAFCVAAGVRFFGKWNVRQAPALLISEENGVAEDRRRADLIYGGLNLATDAIPLYIASDTAFSFDDAASYAAMRAFVQAHGIKLVVVDSFVRVHRREEKDAGEMNALYLDRLKPLILDGVSLLALHHRRKLPAGAHVTAASDNDDIRGSGDIRAAASAVLMLKRVGSKEDKRVAVRHNKTRGWDPQDPFVFKVTGRDSDGQVAFVYEGKPEEVLDKTDACRLAVLAYAADHPGFTRAQLEAHFKLERQAQRPSFSKKVFDPLLKTLSASGYPIRKVSDGKRDLYTLVDDNDPATGTPDADDDLPF